MRSRKWKWAASIAAVVIVLGLLGYFNRVSLAMFGFDMFLADDLKEKLEDTYKPLEGREPKPVSTEQPSKLDPFSLLLLGVDQRGKEQGRSDTMMFTVVRPDDAAMLMVSIPRDSYAELVGRGKSDKIAHAYAFGGAEMAVATVEQLFGTSIDHYASINFEGFRKAVDALGGIALPIEEDIENKDPNHEKFFIKGGQPLYNGQDALNYTRYREDAGGDMSRTGRHQIFINAMLDKATGITQLTKIPQLINIMGENFQTDLTPTQLIELAKKIAPNDSRSIYSHTLDGEGGRKSDGLWYYNIDQNDLDKAKVWIAAWLDGSIPLNRLPLPDSYEQPAEPAPGLSASLEEAPVQP